MKTSITYKLRSGKNSKLLYFLRGYSRLLIPATILRSHRNQLINKARSRSDFDYIQQRVDYYCKLSSTINLHASAERITDNKIPEHQTVYFFDTDQYLRCFPGHLKWNFCPGDVTYVPPCPSIVKSRPLNCNNDFSVVMKLDKVRHFIFVNDRKSFADKLPTAIFRGKISGKESRATFMEMYFGSDICNCGDVSRHPKRPEWIAPKLTIKQHLDYRYIMALEGNDVASNLKWIMSSNSIAVMPRPTCETWFMEGTLIPNYHYIEIKPDFSDLKEKLDYYNSHPLEAQAIIENAHKFVEPFRDNKREHIISLLVLDKYFRMTGQSL